MASLRSKLNRAICAYLINNGCGTRDNIVPANSRKAKGLPNILVRSVLSIPDLEQMGNERITVHIEVRGSASQNVDETNDDLARVEFDLLAQTIWDKLRQTDNGFNLNATASDIDDAARALAIPLDGTPAAAIFAANNSDMAAFTINGWFSRGSGDGEPDDESFSWCETFIFEAICCGSNRD